jgi:aarF domain-containing kinase
MFLRVRRAAVGAAVGGTVIGSVWYATQDKDARFTTRSKVLGVQRAARAGMVWARLVGQYKYLSWTRPTEDASDEVKKQFIEKKKRYHERGAQLVLKLCQTNGGLFIKMGQHAASLRPAIPDQYVDTLTELQDRAPERDFEDVILVLEKELDKSVAKEVIEGLDPKPVGSASLAQVHRCRLKNGRSLAVKVQHAGLEKIVESDLQVIKFLDWAASRLFPEDDYSLAWAVREFETNLKQELDFSREAANGTRMRSLIAHHPSLYNRVWVPEVDFTRSSRRVLSMEFVEGARIRDTRKEDQAFLAQTVVDLFAAMMFTFGFVHCDPHFGNFLVCRQPNGTVKLALLDHGLYRQLDQNFQSDHAMLWRAMISGDSLQVKKAAASMGSSRYADLFPLMLTNRPRNSRAKLGEAIPKDELKAARKQSGFEHGMSLSQFAHIADGLPVDMLFVLRTMHLVKDLHRVLGGTNRDRFLAYARAAAASPEPVPPRSFSAAWRVTKFNIVFAIHERVIDWTRWFHGFWSPSSNKAQEESDPNSRFSFSQLIGEKVDQAFQSGKKKTRFWERLRKKKKQESDATNDQTEQTVAPS